MKNKNIQFFHNGFDTTCVINDGEIKVKALAHCEPEHEEFHTDLAGENLAYYKALEKYYHKYAIMTKEKIDELLRLKDYLFPQKFFNEKKVPKDTIYGVTMVRDRLDKEIESLKELFTEYKEYELAFAEKIIEWIIFKDKLFKKIKEKTK